MKITPTIEQVASGIESWAQAEGWKTVAVRFADEYQQKVGGELIPPAVDEQGIRNATQRVKRIFGLSGPRYVKMASSLSDIALDAMPKRRRMEIEEPDSPELLTAKAMESYSAAIAALTIRCPTATIKLNKALEHLHALIPVADMLIH